MAGPHALSHEVSAFIYILMMTDIDYHITNKYSKIEL